MPNHIIEFLRLGRAASESFIDIQNWRFSEPGVSFWNLYNPQAGMIIAKAIYRTPENENEFTVPDHWSDVVFPVWRTICPKYGVQLDALRFIIQHKIGNETTRGVLRGII